MKVSVIADTHGRIAAIGTSQVRPARGQFASREEIELAKKMSVGMRPGVDQRLHTIDLPEEFAKTPFKELLRIAQVDLSGAIPRVILRKDIAGRHV